ncbi:MAG TPA: zinc ABC transporter substrate-binding protein [Synechococcus sp. M44_DOE_062]|nr:zinc ABC transporter substrate-binding protein [Synechococcus sp. M44_DOE_062]
MTDRFSSLPSVRPMRSLVSLVAALSVGILGGLHLRQEGSQAQQGSTPPKVVTTILPITQFTRAVVGDRAEVTPLIPPQVGPHDFQARPEDVRLLAQADVLVINGLGMETFLEGLIANAANPRLRTIDSSEGIPTLQTEKPEHGHGHSHGHAHGHSHGHGHGHSHGHSHGKFNPHIWLDPRRAIQQVENIRDGLIAADPAGAEIYRANAAAFIEKLKALDEEIAARLAPFAGRSFVVFHDFAPYFAERYNLKAEFLVEIPEANPSPEDVRRVMETVRKSGLKTILVEPQVGDDNPFQILAKDLGVEVRIFDPIETAGPEGIEPEYYLTILRQNVDNLISAFEKETALVPLELPWLGQASLEQLLARGR